MSPACDFAKHSNIENKQQKQQQQPQQQPPTTAAAAPTPQFKIKNGEDSQKI
jgi:hypothetical protein